MLKHFITYKLCLEFSKYFNIHVLFFFLWKTYLMDF